MESFYFKSVVSLVDSTYSRNSREFSPSPLLRTPSLEPVFLPQKLTDFSISRILGLESDNTREETVCSGKWHLEFRMRSYRIVNNEKSETIKEQTEVFTHKFSVVILDNWSII